MQTTQQTNYQALLERIKQAKTKPELYKVQSERCDRRTVELAELMVKLQKYEKNL